MISLVTNLFLLIVVFALSVIVVLDWRSERNSKQGDNTPIFVDERVYCSAAETLNEICTKEYQPVCGNDSRTYGNKCEACGIGKVPYWVPGECD